MATDPGQGTTPPAKAGGELFSRVIAAAAGAGIGAVVAAFLSPKPGDPAAANWWGAGWFDPVCAALGAVFGILLDAYVLSGGKDKGGAK
jgi:hypothetical protein